MGGNENAPEKKNNTREEQKQKEINEQTNQTKSDLGDLKGFLDKVKDTINNFATVFGNAFNSFTSFLNGGSAVET